MAELIEVPPGLADVAVTDTEIGDVLGDEGYYHYRGVSAPDLARTSSFESVAALLLDGSDTPLDLERAVEPTLLERVRDLDLRSAISVFGAASDFGPLTELSSDERRADAIRLIAAMPTLVATVATGEPATPDGEVGHVADFLRMIGGHTSPESVAAFEAYMILTIDHGFSNSTFATRTVASAGADLVTCVLAGYGSLTGPRHGANVERMLDMYDAVSEASSAEDWMKSEIAARRRIQGFGHSVYRSEDPRLALLREHGERLAPERHRLVMAVEDAGARVLGGRRLVPNLDLHAAVVLEGCGVPRGWFTAVFATARVVGWCAHAIEQSIENKILRPAARYVGPPPDTTLY